MKKYFRFIFSEKTICILSIALVLVVSFVSFRKKEEKPSKQVIEDCIENEGYDDVFDYLCQNYSFNEIFDEIAYTYGSKKITDEVIVNGWAEEIGTGAETETSRNLNAEPQTVLPTAQPSPPVTKSWSSGSTSYGTRSWSGGASSPASKSGTGTASSVKQDTTVYVTNTGSKYHKSGCQYLKESKIPISLSDAKAQGYTPCSKCY